MGIKYVTDRHGGDSSAWRRDSVDSAFLRDSPVAPEHRVPPSRRRRLLQARARRRAAVDSSFLLDSLLAPDHDALQDALQDMAAEPPRQAATPWPPQTADGSVSAEQSSVGPRRAVPARPLKALAPVRLPQDGEQAPATRRGVSSAPGPSAPGICAPGDAKRARSVRRKRRAVLWVVCAIALLASLLLILWYSAAPGTFSL
jgi:hypothetical protein